MNLQTWVTKFAFPVVIATKALRTNRLRSLLTALGVTIGVFAVVLAVAVGAGARATIMDSINGLSSDMAMVSPDPDTSDDLVAAGRGRITERDAAAIKREVEGVSYVVPTIQVATRLTTPGGNISTSVVGTTAEYAALMGMTTRSGRFINASDVRVSARRIVIGHALAERVFGDTEGVGRSVRVNNVPFTVIGILDDGASLGPDAGEAAIIPVTAARQRFETELANLDDLQMLYVVFQDGPALLSGKDQIIDLLRSRYRVRDGQGNPFTVRTTEEFAREKARISGIFRNVLVAIASISLLVGGIGIMNIMLVNVTERTREIGLRMAIGARQGDVRAQFLVEAALLCMMGGGIGLALAWLVTVVLDAHAGFPARVSPATAIGAIAFSACIGLTFGALPAFRASRLSPIEALRRE